MASEIYQDKTKERLKLAIENENAEIVNNKINTLEEKISGKYPYEKDDNWNFYLVVNWSRLEIPLNQEQLVKLHDLTLWVNDLTLWVINIYKKNKLSRDVNHFEMDWLFWDKSIDVSKSWIIDDVEYISSEKLNDIFWKNDEILIQKYIEFLNQVVWKKLNYNNTIDKANNDKIESSIKDNINIFQDASLDDIKLLISNTQDITEKRKLSIIFLKKAIENWYKVTSSDLLNKIRNFTPENMIVTPLSDLLVDNTKIEFKLEGKNTIKIYDYLKNNIWTIELTDYNDIIILRNLLSK